MSINHLTFHVQTYLFIDTIKYRHTYTVDMPGYIYIRIWVLFKSLSVRECKCSSVCFCCTLFLFFYLSLKIFLHLSVQFLCLCFILNQHLSSHFLVCLQLFLFSFSASFPLSLSLLFYSVLSPVSIFFLAFSHPLPSFFSPPRRS